MTVQLAFHGAAGCVTGSCIRVSAGVRTVLVDCGMFQGSKTLKALNYAEFPFRPEEIDAVVLTHAHIDHSGLLPKLMRAGYRGPIYATAATRDLCGVMLPDAGDIQESEVRQLNRRNLRRGRPEVEPIYTEGDARRTMALFRKVKLGEAEEIAPGFSAVFWEAGHILGSASVELRVATDTGTQRLLFSGDLGPGGSDYAPNPEGPTGIDHLIVESTYGDRERPHLDGAARRALLAAELNAAHAAGGPLLIPTFAVERAQELIADILALMGAGEVPDGDIFLDSPLAIEATDVFRERGWNLAEGLNPFQNLRAGPRLKFTRDPAESDTLERLAGWHIVLAGSGMCDAGRVRKHLKRLLWRRDATVLICGYQAEGTLGRFLQEGARRVSIQGDDILVRARIRSLDVYSAHADASGLARWALSRRPVGGRIFLVHGEPAGLAGLKRRLAAEGFAEEQVIVPELDQIFELEAAIAEAVADAPHRIAPAAAARADWHNARVQMLATLNDRLEAASNDAERERIIENVMRTLQASADALPEIAPPRLERSQL